MQTEQLKVNESIGFENWCNDLSEEILRENYLGKKELSEIIKNKIMAKEESFYLMLVSSLESKLYKANKNLRISLKTSRQAYLEAGLILSSLKARYKKYKLKSEYIKTKEYFAAFKKYLKDNDSYHLYIEFREMYGQ
jgi:hypothetical protein